jgi:hypothetical protein
MNKRSRMLSLFIVMATIPLVGACGMNQSAPTAVLSSQSQASTMTCPQLHDGELLYLVVQHIQGGAYADKPLPDPKGNLQKDGYSYLGPDGHLKPYKQIRAERENVSEIGNQLQNWLNNNEPGGFAASAAEYVLRDICTKN